MIKEGRVKKSRKTDDFTYERPLTIYSDKGRGMSKTSDESSLWQSTNYYPIRKKKTVCVRKRDSLSRSS